MVTHSFTVLERFSAAPAEVLTLEVDGARWWEWAGPALGRLSRSPRVATLGTVSGHHYVVRSVWPPVEVAVRVVLTALPAGGGALEWNCSVRASRRIVAAITSRVLKRLVALLARRTRAGSRGVTPSPGMRPTPRSA